jgi:hypothetical protein
MKLNLLLVIGTVAGVTLLLGGCKSKPPCHVVTLPPAYLSPEQRANVWLPDQVAPYTVGRYTDLRDPNVLHEAHTLYRREQTSRPNFTPPAALALPPAGSSSASNATVMLRDALTAELNEQRVRSQVLVSQVQSVEQVLRNLSSRTQEMQEAVRESARLQAQLQSVSNRLETIASRLRVEAPASPTAATAVSSNSPTLRP